MRFPHLVHLQHFATVFPSHGGYTPNRANPQVCVPTGHAGSQNWRGKQPSGLELPWPASLCGPLLAVTFAALRRWSRDVISRLSRALLLGTELDPLVCLDLVLYALQFWELVKFVSGRVVWTCLLFIWIVCTLETLLLIGSSHGTGCDPMATWVTRDIFWVVGLELYKARCELSQLQQPRKGRAWLLSSKSVLCISWPKTLLFIKCLCCVLWLRCSV